MNDQNQCPHLEKMEDYLEDAKRSPRPWELWQVKPPATPQWSQLNEHPIWNPHLNYRRRPRRIIPAEPIELPQCLTKEPEYGTGVYLAAPHDENKAFQIEWYGVESQLRRLRDGLIYGTRKEAEQHSDIMNNLTKI